MAFEQEAPVAVEYKGLIVGEAYRLDLIVSGLVIAELKAVEVVRPVHKAQLLTYLRLTGRKLGLLINFNVPVIREGVYRVVNNL